MKRITLLACLLGIVQLAWSVDRMCCDQDLAMNRSIESVNGMYSLVFQNDRNLVLYKRTGGEPKPLWATGTNNKVNRCVMQADGNLVLYNGTNPVWASNTWGNQNATLVVQDDGNLVIYAAGGRAIWASNTVQPAEVALAQDRRCCDQELAMNGAIASPNGVYFLAFQNDRNLVLYKKTGGEPKPLWATGTNNSVNRCVMQADGNLVLYNGTNPIWASNIWGNQNATLVVQDDGNLVIYAAGGNPVWATNTVQPVDAPPVNDNLCCDKELAMGSSIQSKSGVYFLTFQSDRNLVLYRKTDGEPKPIWATGTNNKVNRCVMQADGNLVLYNGTNPVWASNTWGNQNAAIVVQNDGNLVIYAQGGKPIWSSKTVGR